MNSLTINKQLTTNSRLSQVDVNSTAFGQAISDHMFKTIYHNNDWDALSIEPYGPIVIEPSCLALHYGQSVFEGMKAFRRLDGRVGLFRIQSHYDRLIRSLERMCMPAIPEDVFTEGIIELVRTDEGWVPTAEGSSLYLRPFMFASEARFGVKISDEYTFIVFTGPVGPFYSKDLKVKVEDKYMRASHGEAGFAKCAGNYGVSFYPTLMAKKEGFDQVLWTDGSPELNIEESGTMNVMFVIDGKLVTPALSDVILAGVTRDSIIRIAHDWGMPVEERDISAFELREAIHKGKLSEAFGAGTAAVVAPIKSISILGDNFELPPYDDSNFMIRAKNELDDIRKGKIEDRHGWMTLV
jgi:branched-chain amino acid aminotransferase